VDARMMYLHAISPVHTGTGQAVDVIDLPVAREATTNWPYVPGSSIRGVLRTLCRPDGGAASGGGDLFTQAFGPESAEDTDAAGALLFGDGCLLCLPVRSLFGVFAWVSCPLALDRYRRDHASAALATPPEADLAGLAEGEIALTSTARVADDGKVYLEDLDLTVSAGAASVDELDRLAEHIARSVFDDGPWRGHFTARFGVVGDTTFSFLTETATEVTARIKLKEETKTVQRGALWYEEAIPAETIFSTPLLAAPRNGTTATALFNLVGARLDNLVQIGGHAGVGRGLVRARLGEGRP